MITPHLALPSPADRTIVVGDVHGCLNELERLLAAVDFSADDLLLCVGDIVDRGPDTWGVARFFREVENAETALGNHERRLARYVLEGRSVAWSQLHALSQLADDEHEDWARWLLARPAVITTPDVIVTHARLDPGRPLDDQKPDHTCAVGGYHVTIDVDDDGVPLWYDDLADPRPVVIGHIAYEREVLLDGHLYAIDTGCCRGGRLTALVLPEHELVSVEADANHAAATRHAWEARRAS